MSNRGGMIAPSLLSADFSCIREDIRPIEPLVDMWHIDVMDGRFVRNITMGPFIVEAVKKATNLPLDVHLMIAEPVKYAEPFLLAGADILTAHIEAFSSGDEVLYFIDEVKRFGKKAGLSIKPGTDVSDLYDFLGEIDLVLVMSVEPGFGGQSFMPESLAKLTGLAERFGGILSVDGGINGKTAKEAASAGANMLVAGSYIFSSENREAAIGALRDAFKDV